MAGFDSFSVLKRDETETLTRKQSAIWLPTCFFRFSLRSFFLVVIAAGVWLSVVSNRVRIQKQAVDRVKQLGGQVGFDYQFDDKMNWRKDPKLPAPAWLIDLIGADYARSVTIVNFDVGSDPSDDDLKVVASLTSLKQLSLANRKRITDNGLRHLTGLSEMEVLAIQGTNVSGEGFQHVMNMQKLTLLTLDNSPVTDDALQYIGRLQKLELLFLNDTRITDDGLRHLATLKSLKNLQLRGTVSNEGRAWLQAQLPKCKISY